MCIVHTVNGAGCGARVEEGAPLVAPAADVGDDEVLPRPDVHLVPALGVAAVVVELAREDGVARVGDPRLVSTAGGARHRGAHLRGAYSLCIVRDSV